MTSRAVAAARMSRAAWIIVALLSPAVASAQYEIADTYYAGQAGKNGTALQSSLQSLMTTGRDVTSFDEARDYLPFTDAVPTNLSQMYLVYDHRVVQKPSATSTGFSLPASGSTGYNKLDYHSREHVWPDSRQNEQQVPEGDIQMLKPSDGPGGNNGSRGNLFYGGATLTGAARVVGSTYFAGDLDKGDVARICFYGATTYAPTLKLINGTDDATANQTMGDLNSLLHWNYLDTPDTFELRRNDVIYRGDDANTAGDDYTVWAGQKNRNAYIDRPEYVWSVFADQANDTKLTLAVATTTDANGGSTKLVNLGRVLKGGTATAQTITLNKGGVDGTYYSVTAGGDATSTVTGRYNAFAMDAAGSKTITVGIGPSATAGLKTGTVTVDNLDVTTGGGAGAGANDGNDVANVSLSVVDVSNSSFSGAGDVDALSLNFGTVKQGATASSQAFSIANLANTLGAALTAGLDLDSIVPGGNSAKFSTTLALFKALAAGDAKAFSATFDTSALGTYSATYTLALSDEDLPGTQATTSLALTLTGNVVAAPEPTLILTITLVGGTLLRRRRRVLAA